jgi:hypothetical protein
MGRAGLSTKLGRVPSDPRLPLWRPSSAVQRSHSALLHNYLSRLWVPRRAWRKLYHRRWYSLIKRCCE